MNVVPMKRFTLTLLAAASLAGCVNLQPRYERPAPPVAPAFPNAPAGAASSPQTAAATPWQQFFAADPRLAALVELAIANNRDLRIAVLNIETARAQVDVRRADRLPTVGVGASAQRQSVAPQSVYSAGLTVSAFELDLWGRVRSLTDVAAAQFFASEEARRAAQISLVASVANVYFSLLADEELLAITRRTLDTRNESLKLTQLKFDNGASSDLDLRLAQSLVESARVAQAQAQRQRELDENALVLLLGQPLPAQLAPPRAWAQQDLADVPAGLPSDVLLARPDVRQSEQQLIGANANIGAARAAFLPRISLTASAGTASSELSALFDKGAWTFAPQVLMPIFDAGRNRANLRIAEAQRDIAVAQYERAIQAAFRDVADALAGRATLDAQLAAVRAQLEADAARTRLVELRFTNGVASSLEVLDAQRSLFATQQLAVQTQLALLQNRVAVYRSLGGGWNESPAR